MASADSSSGNAARGDAIPTRLVLAVVIILIIGAAIYLLGQGSPAAYTNSSKTQNRTSTLSSISTSMRTTSVNATTSAPSAGRVLPVVRITSPPNVSTVNGVVNITANVIDAVKVKQVQFYIDQNLSSTSTAAPYYYLWNTTGLTGKYYNVTVKAYDYNGNSNQSEIVLDIGFVQHGK